jgi:nicotinamide phosphoribosyltransferase
MNQNNLILATDSYKLNHWNQYPKDTEAVYSYFEARTGAAYPYTVFVGLQYLLQEYLAGRVVTRKDVEEAQTLATAHFGNPDLFNFKGWMHIVEKHGGYLPLRIKAVEEGSVIPINNVMMTVENTDPECFWLTNAVESLLTHVWYSSTVATQSRYVKELIANYLDRTADSREGLQFMLHDFGYRGVSSHESAAIGGLGHLVNFVGTDTLPAMLLAVEHYGADLATLAYSVAATEHSVMTARGRDGEMEVLEQLLDEYPTGILSVVSDSYNIYNFVDAVGTTYKDRILARDGVFVVRPDSTTFEHDTPDRLTTWIAESLWKNFGGTENSKGFKVLDPKVRVLWGDGISPVDIDHILSALTLAGFSAENMVFGMGGGLLQKVNRDTQRFAFKASAIKRNGEWTEVQKSPLDASKTSKAGRLKLVRSAHGIATYKEHMSGEDMLITVFENGEILHTVSFDKVRKNAEVLEPKREVAEPALV